MDGEVTYGREAGLRFACVLDGHGGCTTLDWAGVRGWRPDQGLLWIHLERDSPEAVSWLREYSGIDPVNRDALLASDTRPRVEDVDDALLVVLRGINIGTTADLVPIHVWVDANRVITLRDRTHFLVALRDIVDDLKFGRGPGTPGKLFVKIVRKVVKHIEPLIVQLDDEVDELDEQLEDLESTAARERLGELRRRATNLRRYLAPQREALNRLQFEEVTWLTKRDAIRLREIADTVLRAVENLDLIRDRTTLLHEDLTALVSEQIAKASNRLTTMATLVLPPSLVAGLLGANIGGIPGVDQSWAFAALCFVVLLLILLEWWLLRRMKWF